MANWMTDKGGRPGAKARYLGVPPGSVIPVHLHRTKDLPEPTALPKALRGQTGLGATRRRRSGLGRMPSPEKGS